MRPAGYMGGLVYDQEASIREALAPFYWRNEPAGATGAAMVRLLSDEPLTVRDVVFIRAYIRQWIYAPVWDQVCAGAKMTALTELRAGVPELVSLGAIQQWLAGAYHWGLSPL